MERCVPTCLPRRPCVHPCVHPCVLRGHLLHPTQLYQIRATFPRTCCGVRTTFKAGKQAIGMLHAGVVVTQHVVARHRYGSRDTACGCTP